jgi:hypothetical protein
MLSEEWEKIWEKLEEIENKLIVLEAIQRGITEKLNDLERQVKRNSDDIGYLYKLFKSHQIS